MKALSLLREPEKMALNPAGAVQLSRLVNIEDIKTRKEFKELFPIIPGNLEKIRRRMETQGYDGSQPLHTWEINGELILIDGHHRLLAAKEAGITEVPCYYHEFGSMEEAVEYAISVQVERRNLSDAELVIMIKVVDQLKVRGKGAEGEKGKSAKRTAEILGTNTSKVEKARIVEKYGSEELKGKVAKGELSLNQAYLEARTVREQKPDEDAPAEEEEEAGDGEEKEEEDGRGPVLRDTDSGANRFLRAAVIVLREKREETAAEILVNHFLRKRERESFYAALPKGIAPEKSAEGEE
jgi:ParB family chromosome partitioning protein